MAICFHNEFYPCIKLDNIRANFTILHNAACVNKAQMRPDPCTILPTGEPFYLYGWNGSDYVHMHHWSPAT